MSSLLLKKNNLLPFLQFSLHLPLPAPATVACPAAPLHNRLIPRSQPPHPSLNGIQSGSGSIAPLHPALRSYPTSFSATVGPLKTSPALAQSHEGEGEIHRRRGVGVGEIHLRRGVGVGEIHRRASASFRRPDPPMPPAPHRPSAASGRPVALPPPEWAAASPPLAASGIFARDGEGAPAPRRHAHVDPAEGPPPPALPPPSACWDPLLPGCTTRCANAEALLPQRLDWTTTPARPAPLLHQPPPAPPKGRKISKAIINCHARFPHLFLFTTTDNN